MPRLLTMSFKGTDQFNFGDATTDLPQCCTITNMTITIFGASGNVGRLVTQKLLDQGHQVTALVHRTPPLAGETGLKIVQGDVHDLDAVRSAIAGSDAVVSTLGSWGTPSKDILSAATRNIIEAAQGQNGLRFVSVTGADARAAGDKLGLAHRLTHPLLQLLAKKVLQDSETHLALLEQSQLDWTVIRSPIMTSGGKSTYGLTTDRPLPWATINRQAVADAVVEQIGSSTWGRQAPFIKTA
jgi:putative NADH-flavin reductase